MRCLTIELSVDFVGSMIVVLRLRVISVSFLICLWSELTSPTDGLTELFASSMRALTGCAREVVSRVKKSRDVFRAGKVPPLICRGHLPSPRSLGPSFSAVHSYQQQPKHTVIIAPTRLYSLTVICESNLMKQPYETSIPRVPIGSVPCNPRSLAAFHEAHSAYSLLPTWC
jgi:hypothetical protein